MNLDAPSRTPPSAALVARDSPVGRGVPAARSQQREKDGTIRAGMKGGKEDGERESSQRFRKPEETEIKKPSQVKEVVPL